MKLSGTEVKALARQLVLKTPAGIRYSALVSEIRKLHPETPFGTVTGNVIHVHEAHNDIVRLDRGLYAPASAQIAPSSAATPVVTNTKSKLPVETEFYGLFADFLLGELEEVTAAVPLGGAAIGGKWGTPDIVGVYRPTSGDLIKFQVEIISAEIKVDVGQSVVAFGQAVSYRLFSNKSYLVMPETMAKDEQGHLTARCALFGIGLVFFNLDPNDCEFRVALRAQGFSPDMYYANHFAEQLKKHDSKLFSRLFG